MNLKKMNIPKPMLVMIIALVIVFGGLFAWNTIRNIMMNKFFSAFEPPPVVISASEAFSKTWQPYLTAVGSFTAVQGVDISSEAAGIVDEIHFESGQLVKENDLIVRLDDTVDLATLADHKAELALAQITYERQKDLLDRSAASESEVDIAFAQLRQAEAAVARTEALTNQKHIHAPFDGRLGIRKINLGEYVTPGQTTIVTIQQLDPLYIRFFLPEQFIKHLYMGQTVEVNVDGYPKEVFSGKITAINAKVEEQTKNIEVQATIPNQDLRLYPGMYADIRVLLQQQEQVVTVPQTSIDYTLYGDAVFLIEKDPEATDEDGQPILRAKRQFVVVGDQRENEAAILRGVQPGDTVVDSGQLKLESGTRIVIDNSIKLEKRKITGEEIEYE